MSQTYNYARSTTYGWRSQAQSFWSICQGAAKSEPVEEVQMFRSIVVEVKVDFSKAQLSMRTTTTSKSKVIQLDVPPHPEPGYNFIIMLKEQGDAVELAPVMSDDEQLLLSVCQCM